MSRGSHGIKSSAPPSGSPMDTCLAQQKENNHYQTPSDDFLCGSKQSDGLVLVDGAMDVENKTA